MTDSPHTRTGCSPYGLYTAPSANVSHAAGTVGTTDSGTGRSSCRAVPMWNSGNGPHTGIHISSAVMTTMTCSE